MALSTELIISMWLPALLSIGYILYRQRTHNGVAAAVQLLVCILIAVFFAMMAVLVYQSQTRPHVTFEFPLEITGSGEIEHEFWMTLPPGSYVTTLLSFPEEESLADSKIVTSAFSLNYGVQIDKETIDNGQDLQVIYPDAPTFVRFGKALTISSSQEIVHIVLHIKSAQDDKDLPTMRFSIRTNDELRNMKMGHSLTERTYGIGYEQREEVMEQLNSRGK